MVVLLLSPLPGSGARPALPTYRRSSAGRASSGPAAAEPGAPEPSPPPAPRNPLGAARERARRDTRGARGNPRHGAGKRRSGGWKGAAAHAQCEAPRPRGHKGSAGGTAGGDSGGTAPEPSVGTRPFSRFLAVLSNPSRRHGEDCEQPGESDRPYHALAAPPRRWLRRDPHPPHGGQRVSASSGMAAAVPGRRGRVRSPRGGRRGEESIASLRGGRGAAGEDRAGRSIPPRARGGLGRRRVGARVWRDCQGRRSLFHRCSGERGRLGGGRE